MEREKDFTDWHVLKTALQRTDKKLFFRERDIWLCSLGLNLGREEDGKQERFLRPMIVLRKFTTDLFWAIPLTTKRKFGSYYYQLNVNGKDVSAMVYQMRVLDRRRILRRVWRLPIAQFNEIKNMAVRLLLKNGTPSQEGVPRGLRRPKSKYP
jgi:mRNA interferase MazF